MRLIRMGVIFLWPLHLLQVPSGRDGIQNKPTYESRHLSSDTSCL